MKKLAKKLGFIDQPGFRKIHKNPIPFLGGLGLYLSFLISWLFVFKQINAWIVIYSSLYIIFGLIDDRGIKIRARYKIFSHLLFSFLFVYFSGICFQFFSIRLLNIFLSIGFITFMANSMNMLDGMDGLVGGISAIASFFLFIHSLSCGQPELALISIIISGSCLGFLKYNFNPATIFLGEAGSTYLGFILAAISIKLNILELWSVALSLNVARLQLISFIIPLIILGIPIFDTFFVFSNRFLHQIKFSQPGKDHSHHRIHLMGFSQKATVLTLYAVQIVLGSLSLSIVNAGLQQFFSLLAIVAVLAFFAWNFLTRVEVYS